MARRIDGKQISAEIRAEIAKEVIELKDRGITPGLAVIIVGDDPASKVYVRNKVKACDEVGFYSLGFNLPSDIDQDSLVNLIQSLNSDKNVHGILVQLPLPPHIDERAIIASIAPHKDVDAFSPSNVGELMLGTPTFSPCTPAGIIELLKRSGISLEGKEAVVVGRSNIVGKPIAHLLLSENATVTVCHSRTKNLADVTRRADILVVAVGKPKFITEDMVKDGAVVIDVGINRSAEGKLVGDVDFVAVEPWASYITPVPGGVGPMTIAMLLRNTLTAAKEAIK